MAKALISFWLTTWKLYGHFAPGACAAGLAPSLCTYLVMGSESLRRGSCFLASPEACCPAWISSCEENKLKPLVGFTRACITDGTTRLKMRMTARLWDKKGRRLPVASCRNFPRMRFFMIYLLVHTTK